MGPICQQFRISYDKSYLVPCVVVEFEKQKWLTSGINLQTCPRNTVITCRRNLYLVDRYKSIYCTYVLVCMDACMHACTLSQCLINILGHVVAAHEQTVRRRLDTVNCDTNR